MNTMLAHYDTAMKALAAALNSRDIAVVLNGRDDLGLLKLRAKQVGDRQLLADATEFQMRVERWLGVLLLEVKNAGLLAEGPRPKDNRDYVTLKEIGVDKKLSSSSQKAAGMNETAFEDRIVDVRATVMLGRKTRAKPQTKRSKSDSNDPFALPLSDGILIGNVKIGAVRSRIERLRSETKLLEEILQHSGASSDLMATLDQVVSPELLRAIIGRAFRRDTT